MEKSKRVVGYARVSTEAQDITRQIELITAYCSDRNYHLIKIIQEKISGARKDRKSLNELLDVDDAVADMIIVSELSRLSREDDILSVLSTINELLKQGVDILFLDKQDRIYKAGTILSLYDIITLSVEAKASADERYKIAGRMQTGLRSKLAEFSNMFAGGTVPFQNKDNYSGALSDCKALTFIEIPASVETIEIAAFYNCSSLEMITFEKGSKLESISGVRDLGAFDGAINLTTVDMSECTQVKRIDEYTFYGNSNLRLFKIGTEIPPTCKDYTFYNINPYSVLKVPSGCTDAYKKATGWKKFASITGLDE